MNGDSTPTHVPASPKSTASASGSSGNSRRRLGSSAKVRAQNTGLKQENEELKQRLAQMEALMRQISSGAGSGIDTAELLASMAQASANINSLTVPQSNGHASSGEEEEGDQADGVHNGDLDHPEETSSVAQPHEEDVYMVEISARQMASDGDTLGEMVIDGVSVQRKKKRGRKKNRKQRPKKKNSVAPALKTHTKLRRKRKQKPRAAGKNARKRGREVSFMATTSLPDTVLESESHDTPVDKQTEEVKRRVFADLVKLGVEIKAVSTTARVERLLREELAKGKKSAFYLVNLGHLVHKFHQWQRLLPRIKPHYAMKCNPDKTLVQTLQLLGIGFDCASKKELELALDVGATADQIIFANPCKQMEHILFAKENNVRLMTFDSLEELGKILADFPEAKLVLRILPDDSNSLMPFGTKFGAGKDEVSSLLLACQKAKANLVGVSFHVGSGCYSVDAYTDAIRLARSVFDEAEGLGFNFKFLDIGGGFPGTAPSSSNYESSDSDDEYFTTGMGASHDPSTNISFEEIAHEIGPLIDELFPSDVQVISEPGRFFATAAATLAVNVVCRRERVRGYLKENTVSGATSSPLPLPTPSADSGEDAEEAAQDQQIEEITKEVLYYLSDGIYGSFNNIIFDHATPQPALLAAHDSEDEDEHPDYLPAAAYDSSTDSPANTIPSSPMVPSGTGAIAGAKQQQQQATERSCLFGPTCDSIDVICKNVELPRLNVGDWLYFANMGAYTTASASNFNGISMPGYHYIMSMEDTASLSASTHNT
eukprot:TRINITY_DN1207_c0_g1_i1.p1 TRINITY_DN1207_c0_g1~~TRINITY_DN1207_c0_g1_i1.p1  ORF type:complete len:771 (-),score=174.79 TRINITY_DN1207_c0_g1_i1:40-2352(-)